NLILPACRAAQSLSQRRASCPSAIGTNTSSTTLAMTLPSGMDSPDAAIKKAISSGVTNTPSRLDRVALNTASGTLPRASEVIATEDDTVDGSAARYKKPSHIGSGR